MRKHELEVGLVEGDGNELAIFLNMIPKLGTTLPDPVLFT